MMPEVKSVPLLGFSPLLKNLFHGLQQFGLGYISIIASHRSARGRRTMPSQASYSRPPRRP